MEENNKKTLKKELEEIFFEVYGKENFEKMRTKYEGMAENIKEIAIKKINNLRKRFIEKMDVIIDESNKEVFVLICKAYFNEEIVVKNERTDKEISLKTVLDEVTKDKVKQDNIDEFYIEALWKNYVYIKEELGQKNNYNELVKKIDFVWNKFKETQFQLEIISKKIFEKFSDDNLEILKKNLCSVKEPLKKDIDFKGIEKGDLLERIAIFILMEHYKRRVQRIIKELNHKHSYTTEEKARYKIPDKSNFTLTDIAKIYCNFLQYRHKVDNKYDMLRKIASDLAISELHKTTKSYLIPQSRVINYLAELEIREMNDRKTPAKAINKKDVDNLKNGKKVDFNLLNFQRLATSIYARETNRAKINNIIRAFQIEVYTDFINSLNIERLF